jgi:hypothetical protein
MIVYRCRTVCKECKETFFSQRHLRNEQKLIKQPSYTKLSEIQIVQPVFFFIKELPTPQFTFYPAIPARDTGRLRHFHRLIYYWGSY